MKTLLTILFLAVINLSYSQLSLNSTSKQFIPIKTLTNHERYGHDYVLTDYTFVDADSTILFKLNIEDLELFRLDDENIILNIYWERRVVNHFSHQK